MRHFLDLIDVTPEAITQLLQEAARLKAMHQRGKQTPVLLGRVLGLIFEKPSLRTRVSFEAAMAVGLSSAWPQAVSTGILAKSTMQPSRL